MAKYSAAAEKKIGKVMKEFKDGTLKSGKNAVNRPLPSG